MFRSCSVGVVPLADEFLIYLCKEEGKVLCLSYSSTILNVLVVNIKCCKYYEIMYIKFSAWHKYLINISC